MIAIAPIAIASMISLVGSVLGFVSASAVLLIAFATIGIRINKRNR